MPDASRLRLQRALLLSMGTCGVLVNATIYGSLPNWGAAIGVTNFLIILLAGASTFVSRAARDHVREIMIGGGYLLTGPDLLNTLVWRTPGDEVWLFVNLASTIIGIGVLSVRTREVVAHGLYVQAMLLLAAFVTPTEPVLLMTTSVAMGVASTAATILTTMRIQAETSLREARAEAEHQRDRAEQAARAKSDFLASMSHELRTPLTLLIGPLDDLRAGRLDLASAGPLLDRAAVNGRRLRRLIDDLLDLARLDTGALRLRRQRLDLAAFVGDRVAAFGSRPAALGVSLTFEGRPAVVAVDPVHVETVVYNVVANGLKFTPSGGTVAVRVGPADGGAEVVVADTGLGIAPADLGRLFDRFYQADTPQARAGEGAGVGLALAREVVELHGGEISAESAPGAGTTFRVWFPAGEPDAGEPDAADDAALAVGVAPDVGAEGAPAGGDGQQGAPPLADEAEDRPVVLVVEDNPDLRAYLREVLGGTYRVEEAADGARGVEVARDLVPDLVLSDVMMPELDGFGLLDALKADVRTSHVPVVLLTARADAESRLAGLGRGADDYVSKPFSAAEVEARVSNLIAGRRALRERWARRAALEPTPDELPSEEVAFLDGLRETAEARLAGPLFGVDALADAVAMSPRQLTRKLKALTDEAPGALIRRLRLARAADLLRSGAPVGEVSDAVGFGSRSQFSRAFRETYGVPPSAYPDGEATDSP